MRLFERDESRRGNVLLQVGLLAYLPAIVLSAALNTGSGPAMAAFRSLVFVPIDSTIGAILLTPFAVAIFLIGLVLGVPYLSFNYCYSAAKRYWRGIVGTVLLVSVAIAGVSAIVPANQ
jgi:hypothetical protein